MPRLTFLALALAPVLAACATTTIDAQFAYHLTAIQPAPDASDTILPSVLAGKAILSFTQTNEPFGCAGPDGLGPTAYDAGFSVGNGPGNEPIQGFFFVPAQNGKLYMVGNGDDGDSHHADFYPIGTHSLAAGAAVADGESVNVTLDPSVQAVQPPLGGMAGGLFAGYKCDADWTVPALPAPAHDVALYDLAVPSPAPTASSAVSPSPESTASPSAAPASAAATPGASTSPR